MQTCNTCQINKSFTDFSIRNKEKLIYHKCCKQCVNVRAKQYRELNKDSIKEKQQKWYESKGKEWKIEYEKNNRETINKRDRIRYKNDPQYRIKKILRTRFKSTVLNKKSYKSVLTYIGLPLDIFLKWIEFQFDENMSWENQGCFWDIDHVIPCKSYDLTKESDIMKCYNWKNMRPLEKSENYRKNDKIIDNVIENHNLTVKTFISLCPIPS